jgi:hypothetical protein
LRGKLDEILVCKTKSQTRGLPNLELFCYHRGSANSKELNQEDSLLDWSLRKLCQQHACSYQCVCIQWGMCECMCVCVRVTCSFAYSLQCSHILPSPPMLTHPGLHEARDAGRRGHRQDSQQRVRGHGCVCGDVFGPHRDSHTGHGTEKGCYGTCGVCVFVFVCVTVTIFFLHMFPFHTTHTLYCTIPYIPSTDHRC